ncbi:hypothetical protein [Bradyrhizobium icense]|uniref:Uncharacterized protein n=1 Tax=Bradyrhizobium icense TaxID=1274631 RepID=A0A1B1U973_9BRAD|nr:hypothetical protein [Bradyrhizobium icense]ANV99235.1 hypothetical protein LMTR13_02620 [Bradyrhizobium icense]
MSVSADALYKMSEVELLAAYVDARRQFVEKKFARDTQRARLEWLRAKMFVGSPGRVTERNMAIGVSEEIARKGQELREMTRELDLLKVDVDVIGTSFDPAARRHWSPHKRKTRFRATPSAKARRGR